jgi:uncharacterized Tic20 family protein
MLLDILMIILKAIPFAIIIGGIIVWRKQRDAIRFWWKQHS